MSEPIYPRVQRGDRRIPESLLNEHSQALEELYGATAAGGGFDWGVFTAPPKPDETFVAQITAGDNSTPRKYSWVRWQDARTEGDADVDDVLQAEGGPGYLPAFELTGNPDVPTDGTAIVRLWWSWGGECLLFSWFGGSNLVTWYLDGGQLTTDYNVTLSTNFTLGTVSSPSTFTFTKGSLSFPATADKTVAPAAKLVVPQLTVAGPPTWTGTDGEIVCGGDYFYQSNGSTWYPYVPWAPTTFPPTQYGIVYPDPSGHLTSDPTHLYYDPSTYYFGIGTDSPAGTLTVTPKTSTSVGLVIETPASNTATQFAITQPGSTSQYVTTTIPTTSAYTTTYYLFGTTTPAITLATATDYVQQVITASATQNSDVFLIEDSSHNAKVYVDQNFALHTPASTTTSAGFKVPPGTAPSSPANGDIWVTSASIFARVNGVTYDLLTGSAGPAGSDTYIQFNDGGVFGGVAGLTWDKATEQLTITGGVSGTDTTVIGATITLDGSAGGGDAMSITADGATQIATTTSDLELTAGSSFGVKVGTSSTDLVGLWGASPVAQYSTTGTTTGFTAGSGTTAKDDSTYTGNTGSTAYTVGDIVKALKLAGIIAT